MPHTSIGLLTLHLYLPESHSLKQKRSILKPLLLKLHREFNLSAAEVDNLDRWQEAILACVVVSNDPVHNQQLLQQVPAFVESACPEIYLLDHSLELI